MLRVLSLTLLNCVFIFTFIFQFYFCIGFHSSFWTIQTFPVGKTRATVAGKNSLLVRMKPRLSMVNSFCFGWHTENTIKNWHTYLSLSILNIAVYKCTIGRYAHNYEVSDFTNKIRISEHFFAQLSFIFIPAWYNQFLHSVFE